MYCSVLSQIRLTLCTDDLWFGWEVYNHCKRNNSPFGFGLASPLKPTLKLFIQNEEAFRLADRFRKLGNRRHTLDIEFICTDFSDKNGFIVETWQEIIH